MLSLCDVLIKSVFSVQIGKYFRFYLLKTGHCNYEGKSKSEFLGK